MLGNRTAAANIAVKDLSAAAKFYGGVLELEEAGREGEEVIAYKSAGAPILVYRSEFAGTNKATAVTWTVGEDVEGEVKALKAKGVRFERYDMPGMKVKDDVHHGGGMKVAWFKDPDGNILSIVSG